jgi:cytochrome o ubiquinol oxidase subunit 2
MPPGRGSAPLHGDRPEGAIFKDNEEKGTAPNVGKDTDSKAAPGVTDPGNPANRNMT